MPSKKFFDIIPPTYLAKKDSQEERQERFFNKKPALSFNFLKGISLLKESFFARKTGFLILFFFFLFLTFLHLSAKAEIEIWPKINTISMEKEILVDGKISQADFSKKKIPGIFFSKEKSITQEFTATGISEKKTKAKGTIRVFNNYHLPQILVATTRFISANGKLFRSKERVNIPPGQSLDVEVEAAEPGPEYNIKPTTFSIPGLLGSPRYTAVYGKSFSPMKGGFIGKVSTVTKEDIEKAKENLFNKLVNMTKKELKEMAGSSFLLLDEGIKNEVLEESCSKNEGQEAEKFECSLKLKSKTLGFAKSDLKDFAKKFVLQEIEGKKSIKEESLKIEPSVSQFDAKNQTILLKIKIKTEVFSDIEIDSLKEALLGKSLKESEILLKDYPGIEKTKIRIFPFWLQKIPQDIKKIKIKLRLD